jgi:hypothetical protein
MAAKKLPEQDSAEQKIVKSDDTWEGGMEGNGRGAINIETRKWRVDH